MLNKGLQTADTVLTRPGASSDLRYDIAANKSQQEDELNVIDWERYVSNIQSH